MCVKKMNNGGETNILRNW